MRSSNLAPLVRVTLTVTVPLSEELRGELGSKHDSALIPISGNTRVYPFVSGPIVLGVSGTPIYFTKVKWLQIVAAGGQDPSLTLSASWEPEFAEGDEPSGDEATRIIRSLVADGWKIVNVNESVKKLGEALGVIGDDFYER